jgi:hypothetical protein
MRTKKIMAWSLLSILLLSCGSSKKLNVEQDWKSLFNGENLEGWTTKIQHYEVGDNHGNTFRAEGGIIKVRYDEYEGNFNDRFGHLYYDEPYAYFHLSMEYRFVGDVHPGAPVFVKKNSGVMFHSQDPRTMPKEQNWPISVEMQFLAGLDDGKERPTGNMCSPGTDVVFKGKIDDRHCIRSSSATFYGNDWVKAELIVLGDSLVSHFINGKKVLEYTQPQIGGEVVERHDPDMKKDGTLLKKGFIALQSEGQPIDFRNIKIKNLEGCMNPKAKNYGQHYIKSNEDRCVF